MNALFDGEIFMNPLVLNEKLKRSPYPVQLIVDIHSYCNARCKVCPYDSLKGKNPMGIMEEDLFKKIIDDLARLSQENHFQGSVLFCNMGELFVLSPMALERMDYVLKSGLSFNIQTNAALLHPPVFDKLKQIGFEGSITVSFHGMSPDVYRGSMGIDIKAALNNVEYLRKNYLLDRISIQSIPYHWPLGEARRVRSYFKSRGMHIRMPLPNNRAGLVPGVSAIQKKKLFGCAAGRPMGEMVISFNGNVILCCNDMAQEEIVGNVKEKSIQDVWNGEAMMERLRQIYLGKPSQDDFICKRCEFGLTSKSPFIRMKKNVVHEVKKFLVTHL